MSCDTDLTKKPLAGALFTPADDSLDLALYERVCELLQNGDTLSSALQLLATNGAGGPQPGTTLADLIISDDAEAVGRHVIDQLIQITWAMAERELGAISSENPAIQHHDTTHTH